MEDRVDATDLALAAGLTAVQLAMVAVAAATGDGTVPVGGFALLGAATAVLALRRVAPLATWAVAVACTAVYGLFPWVDPPLYVGALVALFSAAALCPERTTWWVGAASLALAGTAWLVDPAETDLNDVLAPLLGVSTAWLAGRALARQRQVSALLVERVRTAQVEQVAERDRAVAEERLRITRELHDITAHHVSVIAVQAEAATNDPSLAPAAVGPIATEARAALSELRRTLGVLRGDEPGDRSPHDRLEDLEVVAGAARSTGLEVDMAVTEGSSDLPADLQLTVHRIVQEAVTNVIRHSGADRVRIDVAVDAARVRIEVEDDGRGPGDGDGNGLRGMRERAAMYHGSAVVGPGDAGGTLVQVELRR
ncbi:sensor histidine kinase [Dermatobacter hominis]|uniref:sensor histidine kinase n=1 Tax=Dermatobacter hominis TaxID=2884263 RepID=UPI001D110B17|nr:histidine kinase [Dermatobacter hominis]UDY34265.1 histidine kinase [Dermatobacter hominis]